MILQKTFSIDIASAPMVISALPIKLGMTGADVATIQTGLKKLGYYKGSIDGKFASSTDSAAKSFQRFAKLKTYRRYRFNNL
jgi:Putative peptidoglycan binding domain.